MGLACARAMRNAAPSGAPRRVPDVTNHNSMEMPMRRMKFIKGAVLMSVGWLMSLSQTLPAATTRSDTTKEQIATALHSLEQALARGDSATQIANRLYASDDLLTGEGEPGSTRGMADTIKDVQGRTG